MAAVTHLNTTVLEKLPDTGPVVMVNLVRLRPFSNDGKGTGWDAYVRYSEAVMPLIKARGGTVIWAGRPEAVAFGDAKMLRWDYIVLVRYPSRAAFIDMMTSEDYARANVDRENGAEDHLIFAANQTYSKA
jgi:uncharacterized protein (DUF1330 family)